MTILIDIAFAAATTSFFAAAVTAMTTAAVAVGAAVPHRPMHHSTLPAADDALGGRWPGSTIAMATPSPGSWSVSIKYSRLNDGSN